MIFNDSFRPLTKLLSKILNNDFVFFRKLLINHYEFYNITYLNKYCEN